MIQVEKVHKNMNVLKYLVTVYLKGWLSISYGDTLKSTISFVLMKVIGDQPSIA